MLLYAWYRLEEGKIVEVDIDRTTKLVDLFTRVLLNGLTHIIKQGLFRYYIEKEGEVRFLRGKIDFIKTYQRNLLSMGKLYCKYEEFHHNILQNQILKATMNYLFNIESLDVRLKNDLSKLLIYFDDVETIELKQRHFFIITIDRNIRLYGFLIKVCKIIFNNLLIDESTGELKFKDFIRDENEMNKLFQDFVFNFYKIEQRDFDVSKPHIHWNIQAVNDASATYLPRMETDIMLKSSNRLIIIDTKFYKQTLTNRYGNPKFHSSDLYQIYSYIKQVEYEDELGKESEGILLNPKTDKDLNEKFNFDHHKLSIRTIDLSKDWTNIHQELLNILD